MSGMMSRAARHQRALQLSEDLRQARAGFVVMVLVAVATGCIAYFAPSLSFTQWFFGAMFLLALYAIAEGGYTFFLAWRMARARGPAR